MNEITMIERFQCPGCVNGSDTNCGELLIDRPYGFKCSKHYPGTMSFPGGKILLGMPKGFNKYENYLSIRLWLNGQSPEWDKFNVAVWAMKQDGFLFVRTLSPRINVLSLDVIEGGKLPEGSTDVLKFIEEID